MGQNQRKRTCVFSTVPLVRPSYGEESTVELDILRQSRVLRPRSRPQSFFMALAQHHTNNGMAKS